MKLKLLYLVSTALLINSACLQAVVTRAPNEVINQLVTDKKVDEGWHYTIKNNTKQDIVGFMRLEVAGGVHAPLDIKPGQALDLFTLRGKDYLNKDVMGPELPLAFESAIAVTSLGVAAAGAANIAIIKNAALAAAERSAQATSFASAANTNLANVTQVTADAVSAAEQQGLTPQIIKEILEAQPLKERATVLWQDAAQISNQAFDEALALSKATKIAGGIAAGAVVLTAALVGATLGSEISPTHITVWWNETKKSVRKYTFVLGTTSNWGVILTGNNNLEFSTTRSNKLILKINGIQLPEGNILQDKEIS